MPLSGRAGWSTAFLLSRKDTECIFSLGIAWTLPAHSKFLCRLLPHPSWECDDHQQKPSIAFPSITFAYMLEQAQSSWKHVMKCFPGQDGPRELVSSPITEEHILKESLTYI